MSARGSGLEQAAARSSSTSRRHRLPPPPSLVLLLHASLPRTQTASALLLGVACAIGVIGLASSRGFRRPTVERPLEPAHEQPLCPLLLFSRSSIFYLRLVSLPSNCSGRCRDAVAFSAPRRASDSVSPPPAPSKRRPRYISVLTTPCPSSCPPRHERARGRQCRKPAESTGPSSSLPASASLFPRPLSLSLSLRLLEYCLLSCCAFAHRARPWPPVNGRAGPLASPPHICCQESSTAFLSAGALHPGHSTMCSIGVGCPCLWPCSLHLSSLAEACPFSCLFFCSLYLFCSLLSESCWRLFVDASHAECRQGRAHVVPEHLGRLTPDAHAAGTGSLALVMLSCSPPLSDASHLSFILLPALPSEPSTAVPPSLLTSSGMVHTPL